MACPTGYLWGMDPTVLDTTSEADAVQRAIWARMGPSGRLELALSMSDDVRELSISGLLARCPELSRREAQLSVVRVSLGEALFNEAFGMGADGPQ